tara:strand:+ start:449 stop:2401 length:1953 start_codon:yes stop_codon:yes gene_type:complete
VDIDQLKNELPLPDLITRLGYPEEIIRKSARCPFHDDSNPSFGVWESDGRWKWKCHAGCGGGDELDFIERALALDRKGALAEWKQLAGDEPAVIDWSEPVPKIDWAAAVSAFPESWKERLAERRGYSKKFTNWMVDNHLVGTVDGQLAFPVVHAPKPTNPRQMGQVDGAHLFSEKGWRVKGGKNSPWFIGEHPDVLLVFESQWDAFAFMDVSDWAEQGSTMSSILITRGASNGKKLDGLIPQRTREMYLFTQKDEAGHKWEADIAKIFRKAKRIEMPEPHNDLNDWTRSGATTGDLQKCIETARRVHEPNLPEPYGWQDLLSFKPTEDNNCLLGNRWLGKSGSCVWIGQSGLGKSVLTIQAAMTWGAGQPFFGIRPHKHLSSLIIEAENDFGDVAETVQGVNHGMAETAAQVDLTQSQGNVNIVRVVNKMGLDFVALVTDMVAEYQPDMLWIDPLLSYLGGDANSQEDVGNFINALGELALNTGTLLHIIHHTGKPKTGRDAAHSSVNDLSYAGLGSSVLTNWARAIMVLQGVRGHDDIFQLTAAKRGRRAGLRLPDDDFASQSVYVEHAPVGLCWMPSAFVHEEKNNKRSEVPGDLILRLAQEHPVSAWKLASIVAEEAKVSQRTGHRRIKEMLAVNSLIARDGIIVAN